VYEALNTKPLARMCLKRNVVPLSIHGEIRSESVWLWKNQLWSTTFAEVFLTNQPVIMLFDRAKAPLPESIRLLTNTTDLDISGPFYGPIPFSIGSLTNLAVLNLGHNELSGPTPSDLGLLVNLTDLSLENNKLTGSIPRKLSNLKLLESLSLANNELTGPIPVQLYALVRLTHLDVAD
ncbi:hypothetical protein HDU98_000539, partial [Podochytrium sp. JEL0797]